MTAPNDLAGLRDRSLLLANLGLLFTMFAWGSQVTLLNLLAARYDPLFLSAIRLSIASPLLLLMLPLLRRQRFWPRGIALGTLVPLGIASAGFNLSYTFGVAHTHPVVAAVMTAAAPIVSVLVARIFFGERLPRGVAAALILAVLGGLLATVNLRQGLPRLELRGGEPLILLAQACWAWYSLAAQRRLAGRTQLEITGTTMSAAAVMVVLGYVILASLGQAALPVVPDAADATYMMWVTVPAVVMGVLFWNNGVKRLGIAVAAPYLNLIALFAMLTAVAFGFEPRMEQLAGGALVIIAVVLAQRRERPAATPRLPLE